MEVVVTTGAIRREAPIKLSPPTYQHPTLLQTRCPSCHLKALKGDINLSVLTYKYLGQTRLEKLTSTAPLQQIQISTFYHKNVINDYGMV